MNKVLEGACTSVEAVINDTLHLVLRFSGDKVRRWSRVVGAMGLVLTIRGQERGVEDVMDGPGQGKLELISNR